MFPYNQKLTTFQTKEDRFLERKGWLLPGRDITHQISNFLQEKVYFIHQKVPKICKKCHKLHK